MPVSFTTKRFFLLQAGLLLTLATASCTRPMYDDLLALHTGPTDDDLRRDFHEHQSDFQELKDMLDSETKLSNLNPSCGYYYDREGKGALIQWDRAAPDKLAQAAIDPSRVKHYRELLLRSKVSAVGKNQSENEIYFHPSASWKTICYRPNGLVLAYRLRAFRENIASGTRLVRP